MARITTQEQAIKAAEEFKRTIYVNDQCPNWLKKIWVDNDDHGFCLNIKAEKEGRPTIPTVFNGVKVCVYSA